MQLLLKSPWKNVLLLLLAATSHMLKLRSKELYANSKALNCSAIFINALSSDRYILETVKYFGPSSA